MSVLWPGAMISGRGRTLNTINLPLKMAEKVEDLNLPASSINRIVREAVS